MAMSGELKTIVDGKTYRTTWEAVKRPFDNSVDITFNHYYTSDSYIVNSLITYGFATKIDDVVTWTPKSMVKSHARNEEILVNTEIRNVSYEKDGTKTFKVIVGEFDDAETYIELKEDTITLDNLHNIKIKQNNLWKPCNPFVKVGGVFKRCVIWKKINGVWKKGI